MLKLFLISLSSFSSAPCSPTRLFHGVLPFMFIPAGINFYMRHGARGVSSSGSAVSARTPATSSDPSQTQIPTSSKSLIGICAVVGAFLLGSYACTSTCPDPPHAESVSQSSPFGRSALSSTSVERLVLSAQRWLASLRCMGSRRSRLSFPSQTQRMTAHLARVQCWTQHHLTPMFVGSLRSEVSPFAPASLSLL